jgi:hypothetical protein
MHHTFLCTSMIDPYLLSSYCPWNRRCLSLNVYLEGLIATNSDPIIACEALREQNDALRQELHDIRRVCILINENKLLLIWVCMLDRFWLYNDISI